MSKIKVQMAKLGNLNAWLDLSKIIKWKSDLFEVLPEIDEKVLPNQATGLLWDFTDRQISHTFRGEMEGNFLVVVTDCALENNYYMRKLSGNRVCITLFQVKDILSRENIPLENYVIKCIYETLIFYKIAALNGGELPQSAESYTHDETKGCLFDMTGLKSDLAVSCRGPKLCEICYADFLRMGIPRNILDDIRKELSRIHTPLYFRLAASVKRHPIMSILITGATAIILNILSSLILRLFGTN